MRTVRKHKPYRNGWNEVEQGEMWIHARSGSWTGLQINNPKPKVFHARFYPQSSNRRDSDIGTASTLGKAKILAERYSSGHAREKVR
jgi:hypothetical protein